MRENVNTSENEHIEELKQLRKAAAEAEELRSQLETAERKYKELEKDFNARNYESAREREKAGNIEKALRMSQLIVDQSPVILFRRVAALRLASM